MGIAKGLCVNNRYEGTKGDSKRIPSLFLVAHRPIMSSNGIKAEDGVNIKPEHEADEFEDTGECQMPRSEEEQQAWLCRLPKWLWTAWADIADVVLDIDRPDLMDRTSFRPGEADLHLLRNRWGPSLSDAVVFQGHYSRFVELHSG